VLLGGCGVGGGGKEGESSSIPACSSSMAAFSDWLWVVQCLAYSCKAYTQALYNEAKGPPMDWLRSNIRMALAHFFSIFFQLFNVLHRSISRDAQVSGEKGQRP